MCGRKKLPFAGYSVVKERAFEAAAFQPWRARLRRGQLLSNLSGFDRERVPLDRPSPILPARDHRDQAGPFAFAAIGSFGATSSIISRAPIFPSGLPSRSSRQRAKAGGEYRARTGDLLVANQALSQLS